jgi:hypothetical protein
VCCKQNGRKNDNRKAQRSLKTKYRKSRDIKKEQNRGQIKQAEITLGRETLKLPFSLSKNKFLL